MKLAPDVQEAVLKAGYWDPSNGPYQRSVRQLRALLAVAMAARKQRDNRWQAGMHQNCRCRMCLSVAKLERASKKVTP